MSIGSSIRALRTAKGWTTTELAEKANMSQSYISEIENGKKPGRSALEKLAQALGVPVATLWEGVPSDSLAWFWRSRFATLRPSEIIAFRSETVAQRALWAVRQLLAAFPVHQLEDRLGMTQQMLSDLVAGRNEVSNWTIDQLVQKADVPVNFLLNGDVGPIDELLRKLLTDEHCAAWLLLFEKANSHGIPPDVMERLLETVLTFKK
ncbi:MAG: helix-turn-helix domain-containing protein [Bacillota bacterium]